MDWELQDAGLGVTAAISLALGEVQSPEVRRRERARGALLGGVSGVLGQVLGEMIILQTSNELAERTSSKRHVGLSQHLSHSNAVNIYSLPFLMFF